MSQTESVAHGKKVLSVSVYVCRKYHQISDDIRCPVIFFCCNVTDKGLSYLRQKMSWLAV